MTRTTAVTGPDRLDPAPGDETREADGLRSGLLGYVLGLVLAAGLTAASFYVGLHHVVWAPATVAAIATLAIAQMGVHLVFFLHVNSGPESTNNLLALAFGVLIVFLVLAGTIWITSDLNHNMPSSSELMRMQR